MSTLLLLSGLLGYAGVASAETKSLQYCITGSTKGSSLPEFILVGMVNDIVHEYFDSSMDTGVFRIKSLDESFDLKFRQTRSLLAVSEQKRMKQKLDAAMQKFNHTGGIHTYLRIAGCEMDDDGTRRGYMFDAYDGNDFISYDFETNSWIAAVPQAVFDKQRRDADASYMPYMINFYHYECIEWLKMFIAYGKMYLEKKVCPEVKLIERIGVQPEWIKVTCHVSGFYPRNIEVRWLRDGQQTLSERELIGETLPNEDGTYQLRNTLTLTLEEKTKHIFTCVIHHSSLEKPLEKTLVPQTSHTDFTVIGCIIGAISLIFIVLGFVAWRKFNAGAKKSNYELTQVKEESDTSSAGSNSI
ncbi:major histocompatibility complex class I-related gene protein-like [Erpetoichthys calabaricus]|uniref:Major histocompatibility complex class I-related gene protein-like n=1 Tax=Erpetoichthys calabaricus TaxID=27687 RepID=A0A8C4RE25_ERPCA|nr:major histocompatibility complex class I-related gene protein-like [Erpetoichthys calabaricus]